jgi:hypothetical protein
LRSIIISRTCPIRERDPGGSTFVLSMPWQFTPSARCPAPPHTVSAADHIAQHPRRFRSRQSSKAVSFMTKDGHTSSRQGAQWPPVGKNSTSEVVVSPGHERSGGRACCPCTQPSASAFPQGAAARNPASAAIAGAFMLAELALRNRTNTHHTSLYDGAETGTVAAPQRLPCVPTVRGL